MLIEFDKFIFSIYNIATMQTLLVIFIFARLYAFMNYRSIAKLTQDMQRAVDGFQDGSEKPILFITDHSPTYFLVCLLCDVAYLFYCIYLMFSPETWTPGMLLLIIAALESYANYSHIDGTCFLDKDGYYYPSLWWRYACAASSLFILTRLLQLEKLVE